MRVLSDLQKKRSILNNSQQVIPLCHQTVITHLTEWNSTQLPFNRYNIRTMPGCLIFCDQPAIA
jgi:hypothetical protein